MFKFKVSFSVHYQTNYGEFLVLVGNHPLLGDWEPKKGLRMIWNKDFEWTMRSIIPHTNLKNCEYKYVLCREMEGIIIPVRWEEGMNRVISFSSSTSLNIRLDDVWGYRGLKFHLPDSFSVGLPFKIFLFGVIEGNGFQIFQEELQRTEKGFTLTIMIPLWIYAFRMKYNYRILKENGQWRFERGEKRYIKHNFISDITTQYIEMNQEPAKQAKVIASSFPSSSSYNNKPQSQTSYYEKKGKHSILKIKDKPFNDQFDFVHITERIILGPCPQTKEDIEKLKNERIDAVLNLQRDEEMIRKGINWEEMIVFYQNENIFVHKLGIKDKKPEAIAGELVEAAGILINILKNHQKVYIHCAAGKNRSPAAVMAFLISFEGWSLEKTFGTLKTRRPSVFVKKESMERVLGFQNFY